MVFLLVLLFASSIGLSQPAVEYRLLKDFLSDRDIGTGLFLLENYPDSAFADELRIELSETLLERGENERARFVLRGIKLDKVRDEYGERAVKLWEALGLDLKSIVIRFPEHSIHLIDRVELSEEERKRVVERLISKGLPQEALKLTEDCTHRGIALFKLKRYRESTEVLKECEGERAGVYEFLSYIKLGEEERLKEAVKRRNNPNIYLRYAKHLFSEGKLEEARRFFLRAGYREEPIFYVGLIDFSKGKLMLAYENFSQAYRLAKGNIKKARALFWRFKTLKAMGINELALHDLEKSTKLSGFYGAVSRVLTGERVYSPPTPLKLSKEPTIGKWLEEIYTLGFPYYGRIEAINKGNELAPEDIIHLLHFDPYIAIKLTVKHFGANSDLFRWIAYPTPFEVFVSRASERFSVDKALIYAVMRQESLFDQFAVSRSGAMGLMQLIERTAKWKAERLGIKLENVFDPETNVTLGTAYLKFLMDYWKGDLVRVIASYNAGQGRVGKWNRGNDDYLFIESIPYDETRNYVKRVLWFYYIYKEKLSDPSR